MTNQEVNKLCAEFLGLKDIVVFDNLSSGSVGCGFGPTSKLFNIFTSESDCMKVVKRLGEVYDCAIAPNYPDESLTTWIPLVTGCCIDMKGSYKSYEEAVASAVIHFLNK